MNYKEVEIIHKNNPSSIVGDIRKAKISKFIDKDKMEVYWNLAFRAGFDSKVPVKCLIDNEFSIYHLSHLTRNNFKCKYCMDRLHHELIDVKGFIYKSKESVNDSSYFTVECKSCTSISKVSVSNLHGKYRITCKICEKNKLIKSLEAKGCEYICDFLKGYTSRVCYKTPTGDIIENSWSNITRGTFSAGGSHWKQKHCLYLITCEFNGTTYYKIGTANSPVNRLKSLKLLGTCSIKTLDVFETRNEASKQEKNLHKLFKDYSVDKSISSVFTQGISKLGKKMGITEWFDSSIQIELMKIYERITNGTHTYPAG